MAVSNRIVAQLKQESGALAAASGNPGRRIIGVQNAHSLLQRAHVSGLGYAATLADEASFLSHLSDERIGPISYVPLAVGLLTGRYRRGQLATTGRLSAQAGEA